MNMAAGTHAVNRSSYVGKHSAAVGNKAYNLTVAARSKIPSGTIDRDASPRNQGGRAIFFAEVPPPQRPHQRDEYDTGCEREFRRHSYRLACVSAQPVVIPSVVWQIS